MKKYSIVNFIILFLLFSPLLSVSQTRDIKFQRISIESGLSQSDVLCIYQDSMGFLWFGTEDGLNRFDGYHFKVFKFGTDNGDTANCNFIRTICEDDYKNLWIGTEGGGIYTFAMDTEKIVNYRHDEKNQGSIAGNRIYHILKDSHSNIWIGTHHGLDRYDKTNNKFIHFQHNPGVKGSLSSNVVCSIYQDTDDVLWIGTDNGLNQYDNRNNRFTVYTYESTDVLKVKDNKIYSIFGNDSGQLWICTENGLNVFNKKTLSFSRYKTDIITPLNLNYNTITSVYADSNGILWIGTNGEGLLCYDQKTETLKNYKTVYNDRSSLSDNSIRCIYEDASGILWIGTVLGGINKFDRSKNVIRQYPFFEEMCISSIIEDQKGTLWIGTKDGLFSYMRTNNTMTHYKNDPADSFSLSNNRICSLLEDSKGNIWVGTSNGLNKIGDDRKKFIRYENAKNNPYHYNAHNIIYDIYEDHSGDIWFASYWGLARLDKKTNQFNNYFNDPNQAGSLADNTVYAISEDQNGFLWFGTYNGLSCFDKKAQRFKNYFSSSKAGSLSQNTIYAVYIDQKNNVWIGTSGGGINRLIRETDTFIYYNIKSGLPNNVINSMIEDDQHQLWATTNNGLSRLIPESGLIKNYDVNDGLICNEFYLGSIFKNRKGEIFFGSVKGMISFLPSDFKDDPYIPPVVITDFQLFNKSPRINSNSVLKKNINFMDTLRLSYQQNLFSFEFAALHFSAPEKNQYQYKLEGFDKDWINSGNRRFITYTNLDPGNYTFKVKGANKDGVWNEKGISLPIIITPPLWLTWWAYTLYFLVIGFLVVLFIHYRTKRNADYLKNKMKEIEANQVLEISKQKTQYFINLAHETKTPLTLIRNYLDKYIVKVGINDDLLVLKQNFDKLSRDMVNFLDSEKIKNNQIFYDHNQLINLSTLLAEKIPLFQSSADNKNIQINSDICPQVIIKADPYAIDRIINNLIDNAVRYTNDHGTINIRLMIDNTMVKLMIHDNGIGISDVQQKNIFLPFHQLSNEKRNIQGIGMGLYIVKLILDAIGGKIDIKSQLSIGTLFTVTLNRYEFQENDKIPDNINYSKPMSHFSKKIILKDEFSEEKPVLLVVEDNLQLLKFMQDHLKTKYNVIVATNGQEALNKLQFNLKPNVIISDIMMDEMDGYQFFEMVSADEQYNDIPFIFLTAKTSIDEKLKALAKGVIDYVYKPFSIEELLLKTEAILKTLKSHKEKYKKEVFNGITKYIDLEAGIKNIGHQPFSVFQKYNISKREMDVIREMIKGLEYKEVASVLHISENTVMTHIKNIYKKCNINNRIELVNIFYEVK